MPVTWAHAVVAFPVKKRFPSLSLPALICGTMGPDIHMFIPFLELSRTQSHGVAAIFLTALPLVLATLLFYELLVKPAVLASLPWQIPVKKSEYRFLPVILSALLGIVLHLGWDMFTHEHTIVAAHLPVFRQQLFHFAGFDVHLYKFLQYASSLFGTAGIMMIAIREYHNAIVPGTAAQWYRLLPVSISVLVATVVTPVITGVPGEFTLKALYPFLKDMLATGTALFTAGLLTLVPLLIVWRRKHSSERHELFLE